MRMQLYIRSPEKLTYEVVRWNGCTPFRPTHTATFKVGVVPEPLFGQLLSRRFSE
jgi:hypothetical protein